MIFISIILKNQFQSDRDSAWSRPLWVSNSKVFGADQNVRILKGIENPSGRNFLRAQNEVFESNHSLKSGLPSFEYRRAGQGCGDISGAG
jgi:hypothetical protein